MTKLWRKWVLWFRAKIGKAVEPPATTDPSTPAAASPAEAAATTEQANGFTHALPITCTLVTTALSASTWSYTLDGCTWPSEDGACMADCCILTKRDGVWQAPYSRGKFDHVRVGTSGTRKFDNLHGVEYGANKPNPDEPFAMIMMSDDFTQRSNAVFSIWKGG